MLMWITSIIAALLMFAFVTYIIVFSVFSHTKSRESLRITRTIKSSPPADWYAYTECDCPIFHDYYEDDLK